MRLALLIKERNHSPVNQVRAVAFCGVVACNVRARSQNPLAACRLLARRTVARLNSVDCRAKTGLFYSSLELRILFLKDFFRTVQKPAVSVVLTVAALGTRVILAYTLSAIPSLVVNGIWLSIPIGWALADILGILLLKNNLRQGKK